jgi:hypothetical protein
MAGVAVAVTVVAVVAVVVAFVTFAAVSFPCAIAGIANRHRSRMHTIASFFIAIFPPFAFVGA